MKIYKLLSYLLTIFIIVLFIWFVYQNILFKDRTGTSQYQAANRYFEDRNYNQAIINYEQAIARDPENLHAKRGLARSYMLANKYTEALQLFNEAIAKDPEFAVSIANRGILHDKMGNYSLAIKDYRRALQLDPKLAKGPSWLTRFLRNQAERPPSILDRLNYLQSELEKPDQERVLKFPEKDRTQLPYKY